MSESNGSVGKNLAAKILKIQAAVKNIPKRGYNKPQNYHYVLAADAVEFLRDLLVAERMIFTTAGVVDVKKIADVATKSGGNQMLTETTIRYLVMDVDTAEQTTFDWCGHGMDTQDKGIFKAYTGTHKYALMQYFMAGADDNDPEQPTRQDKKEAAEREAARTGAGGNNQAGQANQQGKPGALASKDKIEYIQSLLKGEFIPGPVRGSMDAWLSNNRDKWSTDGADRAIKGLIPFQSAGPGRGRNAVTDKQLAFLEKLVKSSAIPSNLATTINERIANHRGSADYSMTNGEASAMIECINWYIAEADKKAKASKTGAPAEPGETVPEKSADTAPAETSEFDAIQDKLDECDRELEKRIPPSADHLTAYREWRDSSKWELEDGDVWLNTLKSWPPKTK